MGESSWTARFCVVAKPPGDRPQTHTAGQKAAMRSDSSMRKAPAFSHLNRPLPPQTLHDPPFPVSTAHPIHRSYCRTASPPITDMGGTPHMIVLDTPERQPLSPFNLHLIKYGRGQSRYGLTLDSPAKLVVSRALQRGLDTHPGLSCSRSCERRGPKPPPLLVPSPRMTPISASATRHASPPTNNPLHTP